MTKSNQKKNICPLCDKPTETRYRPFCSARCKQVDLGKWLNESYVIPGEETVPANDENAD